MCQKQPHAQAHVWVCSIRCLIPAVIMEHSEVAGSLCETAVKCLSEPHHLAGRGPWELGQCLPSCGLGLGLLSRCSDSLRAGRSGVRNRVLARDPVFSIPFHTSRWDHLAFCSVRTGGKAAGARP